jgi:hypothetical protein
MCLILKPDPSLPNQSNKVLKVLDISYNNEVTERGLKYIGDMMEFNRTLEYLGLAKNSMTNEMITPIIN